MADLVSQVKTLLKPPTRIVAVYFELNDDSELEKLRQLLQFTFKFKYVIDKTVEGSANEVKEILGL